MTGVAGGRAEEGAAPEVCFILSGKRWVQLFFNYFFGRRFVVVLLSVITQPAPTLNVALWSPLRNCAKPEEIDDARGTATATTHTPRGVKVLLSGCTTTVQ